MYFFIIKILSILTIMLFFFLSFINCAEYVSTDYFSYPLVFYSDGCIGNYGLQSDNEGNIYCLGSFTGTVDFDPSDKTHNVTAELTFEGENNNSEFNYFISKFNKTGKYIWTVNWDRGIGPTMLSPCYPYPAYFSVTNDGNLFVAGNFKGESDFNPGIGVSKGSSPTNGVFVINFDSNGVYKWSKIFDSGYVEYAFMDADDNIILIGYFCLDNNLDFNKEQLNSSIKLIKLDKKGDIKWFKKVGYYDQKQASFGIYKGISDKENNIYLFGEYHNRLIIENEMENILLENNNCNYCDSGYLIKLNENGDLKWVRSWNYDNNFKPNDIEIDITGNIYVIGNTIRLSEKYMDLIERLNSEDGINKDMQKANEEYENNGSLNLIKYNKMGNLIWDIGNIYDMNYCEDLLITGGEEIFVYGRKNQQSIFAICDLNGKLRMFTEFTDNELNNLIFCPVDVSSIYYSYTFGSTPQISGQNSELRKPLLNEGGGMVINRIENIKNSIINNELVLE